MCGQNGNFFSNSSYLLEELWVFFWWCELGTAVSTDGRGVFSWDGLRTSNALFRTTTPFASQLEHQIRNIEAALYLIYELWWALCVSQDVLNEVPNVGMRFRMPVQGFFFPYQLHLRRVVSNRFCNSSFIAHHWFGGKAWWLFLYVVSLVAK